MNRFGRHITIVALAAVLTSLFALTALATDEGGDSGEGGDVAPVTTIDSGLTPAVPIEDAEPEAAQLDWTYRYMIPTGLVLAGVIVLLTSIKYFTDVVRRRYRIVEE